jgi:hypothetical protein
MASAAGRALLPRRVLALAERTPTSATCRPCRTSGGLRLAGFRGYVHDAAKAHFDNDFRGHKAYLCGPR